MESAMERLAEAEASGGAHLSEKTAFKKDCSPPVPPKHLIDVHLRAEPVAR